MKRLENKTALRGGGGYSEDRSTGTVLPVEVPAAAAAPQQARLLRSVEIPEAARSGRWPAWLVPVHATFVEKILDPAGYPCHFGANGELSGHNWVTTCEGLEDAANLADALHAFVSVADNGPKRQSLIAFIGPPQPAADLAAHGRLFWNLLERLSALDPEPWPARFPRDPAEAHWQWCYAGRPWFVFAASPGYRNRRSRNLGPCLTMVFQLSELVFDGLGGSTPAGKAAKASIRGRLKDYDAIGPHPHLGDPLHSSTHKWRQYVLPDDDRILDTTGCPFGSASRQPEVGRQLSSGRDRAGASARPMPRAPRQRAHSASAEPDFWQRHVFVLITPDAMVRGVQSALVERLVAEGFPPVAARLAQADSDMLDEMYAELIAGQWQTWRYRMVDDAFALDPCLAMLCRYAGDDPNPHALMRSKKGNQHPTNTAPGHLRRDFGAINSILGVMHASDNPKESALDAGIFALSPRDVEEQQAGAIERARMLSILSTPTSPERRDFDAVLGGVRARMVIAFWDRFADPAAVGTLSALLKGDTAVLASPAAGDQFLNLCRQRLPEDLVAVLACDFTPETRQGRRPSVLFNTLRRHGIDLDPWERIVLESSLYFPPARRPR